MIEYKTKILMKEFVTHDVRRFIIEKPQNYEFEPGQATLVSINLPKWKDKKRPFTFTSLADDLVLEFTIKIYKTDKYPNHNGVTEKLDKLKPGDELIIREPFGTINYNKNGVFIAGGAGITPFIAILRQLKRQGKLKGNKLIFSNKTQKDIILEKEFKDIFKNISKNQNNLILTLTKEQNKEDNKYHYKKIDKEFLKKHIKDFSQDFYICGPPEMIKDIQNILEQLGAKSENLVFEGKE
jgi:ferredoxin-NADP reductase